MCDKTDIQIQRDRQTDRHTDTQYFELLSKTEQLTMGADERTTHTDVDDLDSLVLLEEAQAHGHVLELLRAEVGPPVQLGELLAAQYLDQRDQTQSVRQIELQIRDVLVICQHKTSNHAR